jgi:hypothetical protein
MPAVLTLVAALAASALPLLQSGAAAASGGLNAPQWYTDAVLARIALMAGGPVPAPPSFPYPFSSLQSSVQELGADGNPYVDPTTGQPFGSGSGQPGGFSSFLEQVSGSSSWFGDSAPAAQRERQLDAALNGLGWRAATEHTDSVHTLIKTASDNDQHQCTGSPPAPSSAVIANFETLTTQAPAATAEVIGDSPAPFARAMWTEPATVSTGVSFARFFDAIRLPEPGDPFGGASVPLTGVPVDRAEVLVTVSGPQNAGQAGIGPGMGRLSVTGLDVGRDLTPVPSDYDAAGTALGTLPPVTSGTKTVVLRIPVGFLVPNPLGAQPRFRQYLGVRVSGVEPPPHWLDGTVCGYNGDGNSNYITWSTSNPIATPAFFYHERFPLFAPQEPLHIGFATQSFVQRQQLLAAQLHSRFVELSNEKGQIQAALPAEEAAVAKAVAQVATLDTQLAALSVQVAQAQSFLSAVARAEGALPSAVQAELQARESLENTIAQLQDQLLQAEQAGGGSAAPLRTSLARNQRALDAIDKALEGHDGEWDETVNSYVAQLRLLETKVFALREQLVAARNARSLADETLRLAKGRQATVDASLLTLWEQLADLDVDLRRVEVSAGGVVVFSAQFTSPYLQLQEIDAELAALAPQLQLLQLARSAARTEFLAQQQAASAALAQVTEVIYGSGFLPSVSSNAFLKAGIDTLDYAYDVSKGFGQGGPVGALGAALKKGMEGWYAMLQDTSPTGAAELNSNYQLKLKGLIASTTDKVPELVVSRYVKDAFAKPAKDGFNSLFLSFYESRFGDVPAFYRAGGALPPVASPGGAVQAVINRAKQFQEWATSRQASLDKIRAGPKAAKLSSLAYGFVKDLTKAAAKAYLDNRERQAWAAYFQADALSYGYLPLWQQASDQYWTAYDTYQGLEAKKAELLAGYDPATRTRVTLDQSFTRGAVLTIHLDVTRPPGARIPVTFTVRVAGDAATSSAADTFSISSAGLAQGPRGVGISVEAR